MLIGVEAYRTRALTGCVNDINAVQRLLLERVGVPRANIQRLASSHAPRATGLPEAPATLANIRAALAALSAQIQEGDDVLFYYSGHGVRMPILSGGYTLHREALVPIDGEDDPENRLLYDHELNGYLAGIAAVARSVTCVLDCCHSAGVTRSAAPAGLRARALDPIRDLGWRGRSLAAAAAASPVRTRGGPSPATGAATAPRSAAPSPARGGAEHRLEHGGDAPERVGSRWHVVSACLDFETAVEGTGDDGVTHGLLTRAWLRALARVPDDELRMVRWSHIWQAMCDSIEEEHAQQHPWMTGSPASRVLGGPRVDGDAGLPLRRDRADRADRAADRPRPSHRAVGTDGTGRADRDQPRPSQARPRRARPSQVAGPPRAGAYVGWIATSRSSTQPLRMYSSSMCSAAATASS